MEQLDKILDKVDRILEAQATAAADQKSMQCDITEIKAQVRDTNGTVRNHESRLSVLEDWRGSSATPAIAESAKTVGDLRVELAVVAVKYGSMGGALAVVLWILNALGIL